MLHTLLLLLIVALVFASWVVWFENTTNKKFPTPVRYASYVSWVVTKLLIILIILNLPYCVFVLITATIWGIGYATMAYLYYQSDSKDYFFELSKMVTCTLDWILLLALVLEM